jgi:2-polyprenyl-3-methyl-5-hydroxy-6-metoxy-1,4-benzoquinol methylase
MSVNNVDNYGWESSTSLQSTAYILPKLLKILIDRNVKNVLDLGSGNGALCGELSKAGINVVGVEYDKNGVRLASSTYPDIRFYNAGVQDDPAEILKKEEVFEAVVSTEVIEHLYSPHLLPQFARKLLKSDGYLIISTPYHGYFKNLLLSVFGYWDAHHTALWHGGHIKFWSKKTLGKLLTENGFDVIDFIGAGRAPYIWKSMIVVAKPTAKKR